LSSGEREASQVRGGGRCAGKGTALLHMPKAFFRQFNAKFKIPCASTLQG